MKLKKTRKLRRSFTIGEEWIYYKIYSGISVSDTILIDVLKNITDQLIENNIILKWFFIRYSDPEPHLRVRFLIKDISDFGLVVNSIRKDLSVFINSGEIWDIQLHSYNRELERYGETTINLAESMFFYDTDMVLNLIRYNLDSEDYFMYILKAVNDTLTFFEIDEHKKLNLITQVRNSFRKEFNIEKTLNKQLDKKFRRLEPKVSSILNFSKNDFNLPALKSIDGRNVNYRPIIDEFVMMNMNKELSVHMDELITSFIHMTINRSFRSKQRLHEMLIYDVLYRYYKSKIARNE
ncbi:thiopeptide-type bacteriocin biosynthesis protein [Tenacibaculum agarivorans]|uniref:thiopeptide-type bacteriocin biosynthesis protein n=1 Tax=Tenacibaculum agarivorans TaxID=1908389 RepID=UPI00094BBE34|nr:thiopeptide-type bacteriocin biosynthesis protein [Tenacibaculum agarivorans]